MSKLPFTTSTGARSQFLRPLVALICLMDCVAAFGQWETHRDDRIVVWKTRLPVDAALKLATTLLPYPELVQPLGPSGTRHFYYDRHGTNVFTGDSVTLAEQTVTKTLGGLEVEFVEWESQRIIRHAEHSFERRRTKGIRTGRLALTNRDFIEAGVTAETAVRSEYITVSADGSPVLTNIVQVGSSTQPPAIELVLKNTLSQSIRVWQVVVANAVQETPLSEIHLAPSLSGDRPFSPNEHVWYRVDPSTFELVRLGLPTPAAASISLFLEAGPSASGPFQPLQRIQQAKPSEPATFFRLRPDAASSTAPTSGLPATP